MPRRTARSRLQRLRAGLLQSFSGQTFSAVAKGVAAGLALIAALSHPGFAGEPPTTPFLRIEAGMHTADIRRIAVDDSGRLALTANHDKTARLWDLLSGRLLRVLRPPIGEGKEGKLFACALSPDGTLAAVSGFTGKDGSADFSVYLFDTATGRLVRRLPGLPNVINDLAFSGQGHFLAAALGAGNGLRVWETSTGHEVGRDTEYGGRNSYGVDWHGEERLVTTCFDGGLRLYQCDQGGLKQIAQQPAQGGAQPICARFSPDGQRVAVGFEDSTKVAVHDGATLNFLFAPDTTGVDSGSLACVTWSRDGTSLAAGGHWQEQISGVWNHRIRIWPEGGRGEPRDHPVSTDTIMDLRPLPNGGILFGAADPSWGILHADGQLQQLGEPPIADYRNANDQFLVSADGTTVGFGYEHNAGSPARFSVPSRQLELAPQDAAAGLQSPHRAGLRVTGCYNTATPKLDGKLLAVDRDETSVSMAIAHDASSFLLGTPRYLRSFSDHGQERWKASAPGVAWSVNMTADGRLAVAGYGDGTIRWHRAEDGRELLAFFPHADRKRWVLWATDYRLVATDEPLFGADLKIEAEGRFYFRNVRAGAPAALAGLRDGDVFVRYLDNETKANLKKAGGRVRFVVAREGEEIAMDFVVAARQQEVGQAVYYDCSPGAEDLIGWHVNRGQDKEADFFSASRFHNLFYRPDVVARVLQTRDVAQALAEANRAMGLPETKLDDISRVIARLSPPVVELETGGVFGKVTLPARATEVPIRYRVRQTGAEPPTKVTIRFNGRLLDIATPLPKAGEVAEINVPIPAGMAGELTVLAEHRLAVSEPAVLRVERDGPVQPRPPNLYLVAVGVGELKMNHTTGAIQKEGDLVLDDLPHVTEDARQVAAAFAAQKGRLYTRVVTNLLLDKAATAPALREAFRHVAKQAGPEDVAVFFFSGHGVIDAKSGFYLATYEADPKNPAASALTGKELSTLLEGIKARTVLALDTCHAGGALGGARVAKVITSPNDLTGLIDEFSSAEQGTVVMSSSAATQQSLEDPKKGGLFTVALREGLEGQGLAPAKGGGPPDTTVSCVALQDWLTKRVPELVATLVQGAPDAPRQTPACVIPKGVPDFPIAKP